MARPEKQKVDYFSHDTDASEMSKTITVLQNKYGNDGYAFWFQLLEFLGRTHGHYYDYKNPADLEFLCAKTHQKDTETILNMLKTLDMQGAIDHELYEAKIIWCQKFVDRIADAYRRSKGGIPQKPVIVTKSPILQTNTPINDTETPKNDTETPQIKLKEIKLNKNKNNNDNFVLPVWIKKETWDAFLEVRKKKKAPNTTHALSLIIKELTTFKEKGDDVEKILENSIMRGYTGVFELNGGKNNGNGHGTLGAESKAFRTPERYTRPEEL